MTKLEADTLVEGLQYLNEDYEVRDDYSGRCMYGDTTYAIIVSNPLTLVAALGQLFIEGPQEEFLEADPPPEFRNLKVDSMGRGVVVY